MSVIFTEQTARPMYKILVNGNKADIFDILEILFKYGYVWRPTERIKTRRAMEERYLTSSCDDWEYIIIGHNKECSMVMYYMADFEWVTSKSKYKDITLNEFLELKGHIPTTPKIC